MEVNVKLEISKFLKRCSNAKRCAPANSIALRLVRVIVERDHNEDTEAIDGAGEKCHLYGYFI